MSDRLAQRYERLLEAYPESYRTGRGAEMLGTLLDAARPGQRWPSPREALALVRGGLWTRLVARSPSFRAWWYGVAHLTVVLILIPKVYALFMSTFGNYAVYADTNDVWPLRSWAIGVWLAVAGLALVAVLLRGYRPALAATAVLGLLELVALGRPVGVLAVIVIQYAVLLGLLSALVAVRPAAGLRPPPVWIAVVLTLAMFTPPYLPYLVAALFAYGGGVLATGVLASLLLGLFDLRVPAAGALYILGYGAFVTAAAGGTGYRFGDLGPLLAATLVGAALLAGASLVAQRIVVRL
jgi:hypothetical protein